MIATVLTPTVFADKGDRGGGGGGHQGGGGAPRVSAPAHVSAPHMSAAPRISNSNVMRAPSAPRISTQPQTQFRQAPIARSESPRSFTPSVTRSQASVTRNQRNSPSIAFGGHTIDTNNSAAVDARTSRGFATTTTPSSRQQFTSRRGDVRDFRVPSDMSRNWDRGRVHEWNHHRYRFSGGSCVIIDPGYDYGYPYDNDYGEVTYSSPGYAYDYSSSDSLAASAQDRLNRLGYNAGPADGVIGPQTRSALADFQNDRGLPATGSLDTPTVRALGL